MGRLPIDYDYAKLDRIAEGKDAITNKMRQLGIETLGDIENTVATTNRYSGKVQGNLLDLYDVPTYNLKLYAVTLEALENIKLNDSIDDFSAGAGDDARDDTPSATGKSTKDFKTDPEKMIIFK